jgi:hypothetical protein
VILAKTAQGRALLSERRALSPRERQLLVLADGKRSKAELAGLLGFDIDPLVGQLTQAGHLVRVTPELARTAEFSDTGTLRKMPATAVRSGDRVPATGAAQLDTAGAPGGRSGAPAAVVPPRTQRSLAGSKMYLIGLLQMLRDAQAVSLAVSLHGAPDAVALRQWLVQALVYLHARSGPEYAARVAAHLLEVFPQEGLPELCDDLVATQLPALAVLGLEQAGA